MEEKLITRRIKEIRLNKKLTLDKLARQTGLSKGYLSQIEHSSQPPPVSTLSRLSKALDVDISEFFSPAVDTLPYREITIGRRDHNKLKHREGTRYGYTYEDLASEKKGKNMEPYILTIGLNQEFDIQKGFRHDGEEFLYVLEGSFEFLYKGERFVLEEGDCVYFDADQLHSGRCLGGKEVKLLMVIYSYKRL
jgi:transcriptional regulator with XRE-family HTH domain